MIMWPYKHSIQVYYGKIIIAWSSEGTVFALQGRHYEVVVTVFFCENTSKLSCGKVGFNEFIINK